MKLKSLIQSLFLSTLALPSLNVSAAVLPKKISIAPTAVKLIDISNPEFQRRLNRSSKPNFLKLANHFETQSNKFFCGPTSAVIVLNSLRLGKPQKVNPTDPTAFDSQAEKFLPSKDFVPTYEKYTQHNFFNPETDKIKTRLQVLGEPRNGSKENDYGYALRQYGETLETFGLNVELQIVADGSDAKKLASEMIKAVSTPDTYLIVNYFRPALGQKGSGHISPVGAYDKASDSFLVMDVNPNTASWVWVKSSDLLAAMRTKDAQENRGYVLVSDKN